MGKKYYIEVSNEIAEYSFCVDCGRARFKEVEKTAGCIASDLAKAYPQLTLRHNEYGKVPSSIQVYIWRKSNNEEEEDSDDGFWTLSKE